MYWLRRCKPDRLKLRGTKPVAVLEAWCDVPHNTAPSGPVARCAVWTSLHGKQLGREMLAYHIRRDSREICMEYER